MSAWPEAVWVKNELSNIRSLEANIDYLDKRNLIIAAAEAGDTRSPDTTVVSGEGALWFVVADQKGGLYEYKFRYCKSK